MMVVCLQKVLFVVFVDHDCLAYFDCHHNDDAMVAILNFFHCTESNFFAIDDIE